MKEKAQTSLSTMDRWQKALTIFLTTIAIITPAYYFIGYTYNLGLLNAYGVSSETFKLSIEETYAFSYIALTPVIDFIMLPFSLSIETALLAAGVLLLLLYGLVKLARSTVTIIKLKKASPKWLRKLYIYLHWRKNDFIAAFSVLVSFSAFIYLIYSCIVILIFVWILPLYVGYTRGEKFAESQISDYLDVGCKYEKDKRWSNCRTLQDKNGRILFKGILIGTTDTKVAFFTKQGAIVAPRPKGSYIINTPSNL